jgi:hypothetical protein
MTEIRHHSRLAYPTAQAFAEAYAARSGVTVAQLREWGCEPRACDCGDPSCDGWEMAHVGEEARFAAWQTAQELLRAGERERRE